MDFMLTHPLTPVHLAEMLDIPNDRLVVIVGHSNSTNVVCCVGWRDDALVEYVHEVRITVLENNIHHITINEL